MSRTSLNGSNVTKRSRFSARRTDMIRGGGWIYYPEQDLFVEKVSTQSGRFTRSGKSEFLPLTRKVYGREVFETDERVWRDYLEGHPLAILAVDAWVGHPDPMLRKSPSSGGIYAPDAFAVTDEVSVRDRYVG